MASIPSTSSCGQRLCRRSTVAERVWTRMKRSCARKARARKRFWRRCASRPWSTPLRWCSIPRESRQPSRLEPDSGVPHNAGLVRLCGTILEKSLQETLLRGAPQRSRITPPCDVCTCSMCGMSVPLECIQSQAANAATAPRSTETAVYAPFPRIGTSPVQVTSLTWQCAMGRSTAALTGFGRESAVRRGRAESRGDTMRSTGGRRAYTIWSGHHRKLPGVQDAGGAYLLRSSTSRTTVVRKHQVRYRIPQGRGPVCRRADATGHLCAMQRARETLHLLHRRKDLNPENRRPGRGAGSECHRERQAVRVNGRDRRSVPGELRQTRGFFALPQGAQ